MHYYQFNIGDYAKSTRHLTLLEDLAYRRLLDLYYDTESPLNPDIKKLSRLIGMSEYENEVSNVLDDFFDENEKLGFSKNRVSKEIEIYQAKADTARENGKKGGRPKKPSNNPEITQPVNLANPEETGLKAKHKPRTKNQQPITIKQETPLKDLVPKKLGTESIFEEVWKQWPAKKNKKKALVSFQSYTTKKKIDPIEFGQWLKDDICKRCELQQLGFDMMHFTTYINGERFNDDYSAEQNSHAMIDSYVDTLDFSDVPR